MAKKNYKDKKERIEILLDPEKDEHIIQFLNDNARTRAGFIRQLLNDHVRQTTGDYSPVTPKPEKQVKKTPEPQAKKTDTEKPKRKRMPNLQNASLSSKNLIKDDE